MVLQNYTIKMDNNHLRIIPVSVCVILESLTLNLMPN